MKTFKALFAIVLAAALALGLFACAPEEAEEEMAAKTSLAAVQSDPLAYLNAVVGQIKGAEEFVMETGYKMDDIEVGSSTLKAAKNAVKSYIIDFLKAKGKVAYKKDEAQDLDLAALCPALFSALLAQEVPEGLKISEVLELEVAKRLEELEKDLAEGRNTSMKGKDNQEKRDYVIGQISETEVKRLSGLYQIEGTLSLAAAERLLAPADKAAIQAELAIAKEYLLVDDYSLEHTEFTLFAQVNKDLVEKADAAAQQVKDPALSTDHIKEFKLELKSSLTATATGAGAFEGEGEFPITLTLTKTVTYKDIVWEKKTILE